MLKLLAVSFSTLQLPSVEKFVEILNFFQDGCIFSQEILRALTRGNFYRQIRGNCSANKIYLGI